MPPRTTKMCIRDSNIDDVLGFKLFYGSKGLKNIPKYSNFTNVFLCVVDVYKRQGQGHARCL